MMSLQESQKEEELKSQATNEQQDTPIVVAEVLKFENETKKILEQFYSDDPMEAHERLLKLEQGVKNGVVELQDGGNAQEAFEIFQEKEEIRMLRKDFQILDHFLQEIRGEMRDWVRHTDKPHRKVFYQHEQSLKGITIYLEGIIESPLMNLFSVLGEVELFKDWIPITKESKLIAEVSHLRKLCYIRNNFPWPFHNREMYLQACGITLKDEKASALTLSSVTGDTWLGHKIDKNSKYVTTDIHRAFIYARSLGKNKCQMKMIINADPHMDYIPQKLINWCLKNVIGVFIRFIQKRSQKLPDENKKLMLQKKEFYDWLQVKICDVIEEDGEEEQQPEQQEKPEKSKKSKK